MELASKSNQVYLLVKMLVIHINTASSHEGDKNGRHMNFTTTFPIPLIIAPMLINPPLPPFTHSINLVNVNAVSHVKKALKLIVFDLFGLAMLLKVDFKMLKVAQCNRFFIVHTSLR